METIIAALISGMFSVATALIRRHQRGAKERPIATKKKPSDVVEAPPTIEQSEETTILLREWKNSIDNHKAEVIFYAWSVAFTLGITAWSSRNNNGSVSMVLIACTLGPYFLYLLWTISNVPVDERKWNEAQKGK